MEGLEAQGVRTNRHYTVCHVHSHYTPTLYTHTIRPHYTPIPDEDRPCTHLALTIHPHYTPILYAHTR
jgi:hypothetical protein